MASRRHQLGVSSALRAAVRWGWFEARRAGSRADGKGVLRHAWVSVCPSWLWAGVQGRQTGRHRRRASTGFHPLPPVSQKTGEQLVTSMLCSELFLQSCSLTRSSRTLLCPLWTWTHKEPGSPNGNGIWEPVLYRLLCRWKMMWSWRRACLAIRG